MLAGAVEYVADLIRWWAWQAAALGPRASRRRARPLLRLARAGVTIETPDGAIRHAAPAAAGAALAGTGLRRGRRVDLLIEADRHLLRALSPLRVPRSRLATMAALDRDAATPLRGNDCVLLLPRLREDDARSLYALVRRDHLAPLLDGLAAPGLRLGDVALATAQGRLAADGPSRRALGAAPPGGAHWLGAATALALAGLVALGGALAWRQEHALAALGARIAQAEARATGVRADLAARQARIDRLAALREAKSGAVPVIRVLEELARTLPDGTWLDSVEIDAGGVVLSGTSSAAAALVPRLEAAPLFHATTFTEPVRREPGVPGERFTVALQTGRGDG